MTCDMSFTSEQRYLLEMLSCFISGKSFDRPMPEGDSRQWLQQKFHKYNLLGICSYMTIPDAGAELAANWAMAANAVMVNNMRAMHVMAKLFKQLDEAKITAAVMRGLSLCSREYPDISLRPMGDVDMLVDSDQQEAFEQALAELGHKPAERFRSQLIYDIDGVHIEVHLQLLTSQRYTHVSDRRFMLDGLLSQPTPTGQLHTLSLEAEFVGLVTHGLIHHDLNRMTPLLDIALMLHKSPVNWESVAKFCRQHRLSRMFALSIALVESLFFMDFSDILSCFAVSRKTIEPYLPAYKAQLFGELNAASYIKLRKSLLAVAETPLLKLRQLARFISIDEYRKFTAVMQNAKSRSQIKTQLMPPR